MSAEGDLTGHLTTSPTIATTIIVVKTGIPVLGGLITYFSYRAYRNTGTASPRALAFGSGVVTLDAMLGSALDVILNVNLVTGLFIDSVLTLIGLAIITYSLYVD